MAPPATPFGIAIPGRPDITILFGRGPPPIIATFGVVAPLIVTPVRLGLGTPPPIDAPLRDAMVRFVAIAGAVVDPVAVLVELVELLLSKKFHSSSFVLLVVALALGVLSPRKSNALDAVLFFFCATASRFFPRGIL